LLPKFNRRRIPLYIVLLAASIFFTQAFNNKIQVSYERALDFRLQIWEVSFKIFKENPIFGNLKLPEKDLLNYNHYMNGKYYFLDSDLNSHNQYLSILMKYGALGAILFLFFVMYISRLAIKKTDNLIIREFIGFSLILLIVFYIENVLDRHHGIVYATFFYNYYLVAIENE